jgi:pectinesterase
MKAVSALILAVALVPAAFATTRNVPSSYSTVQAAINAAASGDTISIANGTYTGVVAVPSTKTNLIIQGASNTGTILTSGQNQTTMTVSASGVTFKNLTLKNSYTGDTNTNHALFVYAQKCTVSNCYLIGRQDTLYCSGSLYVTASEIQGSVDFIYGSGKMFISGSRIVEVRGNGATIAAPNTASSQTYGIVFSGCTITNASGVASGSTYLGRPWGAYGQLAYINCTIGSVIATTGYINWSGTSNSSTCRFVEYVCPSGRASWVTRLTSSQAAAYTKTNVLGW